MSDSVQLVTFEVDKRQYGIPLHKVQRVIRAVDVTPLSHCPAIVLGVIDVHGAVVAVFSVRRRVGAAPRCLGLNDQFIIVHGRRRIVALAVDHVCGLAACAAQEVIAPESVLPQWNDVRGIVKLASGLILIQELDTFLSIQDEELLEESLREGVGHGS